jgi:hypothetical protein
MPTATLVPNGLTDANSNVSTGAVTDIDETIDSADASFLGSVTGVWTGSGAGSAFTFDLTDLPSDAASVNTVQFRVRARVNGTWAPKIIGSNTYICDVQGTNAPSTAPQWNYVDARFGVTTNRGDSSGAATSASVADVNAWTVRVYQFENTISGGTDHALEIDCVEIIVDYNSSVPSSPSGGAANSTVQIIPSTPDSIWAICIAQVRDFVVMGGVMYDRYSIQWNAIGDPTDWPTPNTDDARSKQAGKQAFPTQFGNVTAISSGDFYAYVFQERAVTKMTYVGGDIVFAFDTFEEGRGCRRQGRMLQIDDKLFFQSDRGYHVLENDQITDIGFGAVDDSY